MKKCFTNMEEITLKDTLMMVFHSRRCGMCLCFFWASGLTLSSPEWKTIVFWASERWRREGLFDEGDKLSLYIKEALFLSEENYLLSIPAMSMWIKLSSNGPQVHQITPLHQAVIPFIPGWAFSASHFLLRPFPLCLSFAVRNLHATRSTAENVLIHVMMC